MNINTLVNSLLAYGFTQQQLADKMTEAGVITRQATISRMSKNESYVCGSDKFITLYKIYQETVEGIKP